MTEGPPWTGGLANVSLYFQLVIAMAMPTTATMTRRWIATKLAKVAKTSLKGEVFALTVR